MKKLITLLFLTSSVIVSSPKTPEIIIQQDSLETEHFFEQKEKTYNLDNVFNKRLKALNRKSPMDLRYNEKVKPFIINYIGANKKLISKMKGLSPFYFNLFEEMLDKYNLPLELKYLPKWPKKRFSTGFKLNQAFWARNYCKEKGKSWETSRKTQGKNGPKHVAKTRGPNLANPEKLWGRIRSRENPLRPL